MQSVIGVWYLTAGYQSQEASEMRLRMGQWDSEFSLRHMIQVLQRSTLNATIKPNSADPTHLRDLLQTLQIGLFWPLDRTKTLRKASMPSTFD